MPSWKFKEESNREVRVETQRRSQPRSRRIISVLKRTRRHHGMKVCCWNSFKEGSGEEE